MPFLARIHFHVWCGPRTVLSRRVVANSLHLVTPSTFRRRTHGVRQCQGVIVGGRAAGRRSACHLRTTAPAPPPTDRRRKLSSSRRAIALAAAWVLSARRTPARARVLRPTGDSAPLSGVQERAWQLQDRARHE